MMIINDLNKRTIKKQDTLIEALEVSIQTRDTLIKSLEASNQMRDKYIAVLETARKDETELHKAEMAETTKLYSGAVQHVAAERDEAIALADELKKDVQHWQAQFDKEHAAFVQAAEERDMYIRKLEEQRKQTSNWRNRAKKLEERCEDLQAGLPVDTHEARGDTIDHMRAFIDSICEMIACDADLDDIADECIRWRKGEWQSQCEKCGDCEGNCDPYRYCVYVVEKPGDERVFTGFFADYDLARESVDLMIARGCYEAWVEDKA